MFGALFGLWALDRILLAQQHPVVVVIQAPQEPAWVEPVEDRVPDVFPRRGNLN